MHSWDKVIMVRINHIIVILIALNISYAEISIDHNNFEDNANEENTSENQILIAPSAMTNGTNKKLDDVNEKSPENVEEVINHQSKSIDKNIIETIDEALKIQLDILENKLPERLEKYIENNISILEKRNHDIQASIQEDIYEKVYKLEKNLFDKLEEYIDEKFNSFEKRMYRKINDLEKLLPQKTDTNLINYKLDVLKKMQLDSDESAPCTCAKKVLIETKDHFNETLNLIKKINWDLQNTTNNSFVKLDTSFTNLEDYLSMKFAEIVDVVSNFEENIDSRLDVMDKNITEQVQENIDLKLDTMEKNINEISQSIKLKLDTLDKQFEQNIDQIQKEIPELQQIINSRMDELQDLEKDVLEDIHLTRYSLSCKEQYVTGGVYATPYHRLDEDTLKHVTYRMDSDGLAYFEMYLAVKGNVTAHILLSSNAAIDADLNHDIAFEIEIGPNYASVLKTKRTVASRSAPEILTATRFTALQVKIKNGKLEMVKGSSSPVISYSDPDLSSVKHFSFGATKTSEAIILYDCPLSA